MSESNKKTYVRADAGDATEILRTIMENIPVAVSLFDGDLQMVACNRKLIDLLGFPESLFDGGLPSLETLARFNAERGEFGPGDPEDLVAAFMERARNPQAHRMERIRPDGTVLGIEGTPLPDGGFVTIYSDVTESRRTQQDLETNLLYLHAVLDHLSQGISVFDEALHLKFWNKGLIDVLTLPEGTLHPDATFHDVMRFLAERGEYGPGDPEELAAARTKLALKFLPHRFERTRPNGRTHLVDGRPMLRDGHVVGFVTSYTDITERHQIESELRTRNDTLRKLIDNIPGGVTLFDRDFRLVAWNHEFQRMLDFPDELFVDGPTLERFARYNAERGEYGAGDIDDIVAALLERAQRREPHVFERSRPNGMVLEVRGLPLDDGGFVTIYTDITSHKATAAELERLAHRDVLTGLANRYTLEARLDQVLADAARDGKHVALMFIDMDRFKSINDTLGHTVGDAFLISIATRLSSTVRESDIVARLGGDEFVVVAHDLDNSEPIEAVATKIVNVLGQPAQVAGRELLSTASIGIAVFPADGDSRETLMRNADIAMYHAKESGRGRHARFEATMSEAALARTRMESDLRQALVRHEFLLHYQPQVRATDGALVGFEALIRWQRGERMISPAEFIPLAEESGTIWHIGAWVLRVACRAMAGWRAAGLEVGHVAVNLSAHQIKNTHLVALVREVLLQNDLPPQCLELEITETAAMENPQLTIENLSALRALGVSLAIDDFGTGYSSLAYLKLLPISRLKLDRTFVMDIESDPNDAAICRATIGLAHSLGLEVVAEGVETLAQLDYLRELECDKLQGYYFSKPLPEAGAREFARGSIRDS